MLAVAAQLPAAVLADEASGATAIATIAQIADAEALVLTMKPPLLTSMNEASVGTKGCACLK
jgi:prophage DNA circulation protein